MTTYKMYHLVKFTTKGYVMTDRYLIFTQYMEFKGTADTLKIAKIYVDDFVKNVAK